VRDCDNERDRDKLMQKFGEIDRQRDIVMRVGEGKIN